MTVRIEHKYITLTAAYKQSNYDKHASYIMHIPVE